MAKYDRRILLPYLRNVYTMELLTRQQKQQHRGLQDRFQELNGILTQDKFPKKVASPSPAAPVVLGVVAFLFLVGTAISATIAESRTELWFLPALSITACVLFALLFLKACGKYRKKSRKFRQYCKKAEQYVQRSSRRELAVHEIEDCRNELADMTKRMAEAQLLQHTLCNLNVIPVQYRTLSAFGYLFDYFLSSKANDVDIVIQSYAVEHLKENDPYPDEQTVRTLLHQRAKIADNITADPVQRQYYISQLQEIVDAEPSPDLRNQYQKMIQTDLKVSAYFSQYEYGRI